MCKIFGLQLKNNKLDIKKIIEYTVELSKQQDIIIQLFDARYVYGSDHIISAYQHAKRAFALDYAISGSIAMEVLLYVAGEYQIKNALSKLGLKDETTEIALLIIASDKKTKLDHQSILDSFCSKFNLSRDDNVLLGNKETLKYFGITQKELDTVPEERWFDLVLERVALVDIKK